MNLIREEFGPHAVFCLSKERKKNAKQFYLYMLYSTDLSYGKSTGVSPNLYQLLLSKLVVSHEFCLDRCRLPFTARTRHNAL